GADDRDAAAEVGRVDGDDVVGDRRDRAVRDSLRPGLHGRCAAPEPLEKLVLIQLGAPPRHGQPAGRASYGRGLWSAKVALGSILPVRGRGWGGPESRVSPVVAHSGDRLLSELIASTQPRSGNRSSCPGPAVRNLRRDRLSWVEGEHAELRRRSRI